MDSIDINSEKDLWLALFNAKTEEELETLITVGGEVMSQAIEAYRGITALEEFRYLEILRERTRHDEAQAIYNAEKRGEERMNEHWQGVVAYKDAALAEKDAENEKLRQMIASLQASKKDQGQD